MAQNAPPPSPIQCKGIFTLQPNMIRLNHMININCVGRAENTGLLSDPNRSKRIYILSISIYWSVYLGAEGGARAVYKVPVLALYIYFFKYYL